MMKAAKRIIFSALIMLMALSSVLSAGDAADSATIRSQRLAGLCRVWGAIKYFHPYLAYRNIDWDSALTQTLPKALQATTAAEYRAAIELLLSYVKDPNTHVLDSSYRRSPAKIIQQDSQQPYMVTTDGDYTVVVASDYGQFIGDEYKPDQLRDLFLEASKTHGLVIDIRRLDISMDHRTDSVARASFREAFIKALPVLLHDDLIPATDRRRVHVGYIPQVTPNAGDYSSAFEYANVTTLNAAAGKDDRPVPIVFVVNEGSDPVFDILAGLQIAHRAKVVYEGYFDLEGGIESYDMTLPDSLTVRMRVTEIIKTDGTLTFDPDLVLPFTTDTTLMDSPPVQLALNMLTGKRVAPPVIGRQAQIVVPNIPEMTYADMAYPDVEYRLLALFRLWNIVGYFSPLQSGMTDAWDSALTEFIPRMEAASDSLDYVLTLAELAARMHDSRVTVETPLLRYYFGVFYPEITVRYIDGQTVVSDVREDAGGIPDIRRGDIILTIDGEDIATRRNRLSRLLSGSTSRSVEHRVDSVLLGGRNGSEVRLAIRREDGKQADVVITRHFQYWRAQARGEAYEVLPNGFGYIDLDRLSPNAIGEAMAAVKNTRGLILDLRGDVEFPPQQIASYFAKTKTPAFSISTPERYSPDVQLAGERDVIESVEPNSSRHYAGRVVALIDGGTGAHAERTALMLVASDNIVFIGMPTCGNAGVITSTVLPGDIRVIFTGSDVRNLHNQSISRTGIRPDIIVEPTISSIRNGSDEILEAAVRYLTEKK